MELKQLHEEMLKTHNEFKSYVDRELGELKKSGVSAPETKAALDKMNEKMSEIEKQIADVAAKAARPEAENKDGLTADERTHSKAFMQWVRKGDERGLADLQVKAMSVGSDADGGYLVPKDMSGRIVQRIFDTTPMQRYANVVSISTDSISGPIDRDEASCGWVAEKGSRTETNTPTIGQWNIPTHEIYAFPMTTQKILDDAANDPEAWLARKVADKISRTVNAAFVSGNGVGKPRGFTTYTTAATADSTRAWQVIEHVATGNNGDWASSDKANTLFDVESALNPGYRPGARWMMPRAALLAIRKFKGTTTGDYLWQPGLQDGRPALLLGYPVIESEDMPAIATNSLSVAFANWSEAVTVVNRIGIRVLRDPFTNKPYVGFYTTARVGGDVTNFDAIKFIKFAA